MRRGYDEVRRAERESAEEETRRLYYVAMTRAIDRLILAGALDPDRDDAGSTPIGWVVDRLGAAVDADAPFALDVGGVHGRRCGSTALPPRRRAAAPAPAEQLELFSAEAEARQAAVFELAALPPLPEPPPSRRSGASPTARSRCSSAARTGSTPSGSSACREDERGPGGIRAAGSRRAEIGDAVHVHLEEGGTSGRRWRP